MRNPAGWIFKMFFKDLSLSGLIVVTLIVALGLVWSNAASTARAGTEVQNLQGAGATFPMPIYSKWASRYYESEGIRLAYQGIGSGAGIAQIKAKTVDFGASDAPLSPQELEKDGLVQFPMIVGGVVPVFNIEGVSKEKLRLTSEVLADIYLGNIKNWSDRRIKALNAGLKLPDQDITVVHRADGSGTTWIFTTYLSKVSPDWKTKVGADKSVSWPTGVGGKGNPGVASLVKKINGSIGYVEFAYALKERLKWVSLQNRAGEFVTPTMESFEKAAQSADWGGAAGFNVDLTDQAGEKTWPIVGTSFILIHKDQQDKDKALLMLSFFDWCFKNGAGMAKSLHYVAIPQKGFEAVQSDWKKQVTCAGEPLWK
jgi:phosphate transport system substrate-binding protein